MSRSHKVLQSLFPIAHRIAVITRYNDKIKSKNAFKGNDKEGEIKMAEQFNKQKQEADEDKDPENVKREGFTAEELGEASAYDSTTEIAQMMRRGDETKGDPNNRDVVGATTAADNDDNKPVPRHQRGADDLSDKNKKS